MSICETCGLELERTKCLQCEREIPADGRYCCYCGSAVGQEEQPPAASAETGDPYDPDNRVLCSDENCIGIIGENGVCTECGRPAEPVD